VPDAGPALLEVRPEDTVALQRERILNGPLLSGSLYPKIQATVRAELSGSVEEVSADLGQPVKKGEVLARMADHVQRAAVQSTQSLVSSAEQEAQDAARQVERAETLFTAGAMTARDQEQVKNVATAAQARLADARARLAAAQEQLKITTVRAPLDGVVSQRAVHAGDVVTPSTPLFTIIDPSSMRLEASVPSDALPALAPGKAVEFRVRGYPQQTFTGTIDRIAPAADPVTRQLTLLVSIPNPGGKLIAGLFAEGRVTSESREALVAPAMAVDASGSGASVLCIRNGRVEKIPVTVGLRDELTERMEVIGDVREGDILITGAARSIPPGTLVQLERTQAQVPPTAVHVE
jgi:RND family efflux transporter MFP subunit